MKLHKRRYYHWLRGGPGTPPLCSAVHSHLPMDWTTSSVWRSGSRGLLSSTGTHSGDRHEDIPGPQRCKSSAVAYRWPYCRKFVTRVAKLSSSWMSAKPPIDGYASISEVPRSNRPCICLLPRLPNQGVASSELTSHTDWVNERYSRCTAHSRASRKVAGQLKSPRAVS